MWSDGHYLTIKDNIQSAIFERKIIKENRFKIASKIEQYNPLQNVVAQIKNVKSPMKKQWLPHGSMFFEQTANKGKKHYARYGHQQHLKKARKGAFPP